MNHQPDEELQRHDDAAYWALRLSAGVLATAERQALDAWLRESPLNREALDFSLQTWTDLGSLELPAEAAPSLPTAQPPAAPRAPRRRRRWPRVAAVAAVLLIAVVVGLQRPSLWLTRLSADYASATGEVRRIDLPDGSQVQLDAESALDLAFDDQTRRVRLLRGNAVFTVAPMVGAERRPFVVDYAGGRSQALGTRFVVGGDSQHTAWVGMLEHSVAVRLDAPPRQGQQEARVQEGRSVEYDAEHGVRPLALDPQEAAAWRNGLLIFKRVPLQQVVERLQHYRHDQIWVYGQALAQREVSGLFRLDSMDSSIDTLARELGARSVRLPGLTLLY